MPGVQQQKLSRQFGVIQILSYDQFTLIRFIFASSTLNIDLLINEKQ